jgi:hypothetical protein
MSSSFSNSGIFAPDAGDAMDGGGSLPSGSGIVAPPSRRNKFREALMAASKYKSETDYKAEKESKEKEKRAAQRNTMKIDDNTSVMEGYTDPGFRVEGVKGRSLLGTVGAVVTPFAPLTGQAIGAVGNLTGY